MKLTIFFVFCLIGYVMSESCTSLTDCPLTSCSGGFDKHCLDNNCLCLSPATGATCNSDGDCEHADHGHEHCQFDGDKVWKCVQNTCRCQSD
ncbi:hypothetical protein ACF0H5_013312 [Mactra antiquata]